MKVVELINNNTGMWNNNLVNQICNERNAAAIFKRKMLNSVFGVIFKHKNHSFKYLLLQAQL
jgi:hypothetical protein